MIILNEKKYAEKLLNTGEITQKPYQDLIILAKYYYYCQHKNEIEIKNLLTDFLQANYKRYTSNRLAWDTNIDKIVNCLTKFKMIEIEKINITNKEMASIQNLKDKNMEQVAFALLCLAKYGNIRYEKNNNWVNEETRNIFKMANVQLSLSKQDYLLGNLQKLGLISFPKKGDNLSICVNFIDDDTDVALSVSDFRSLGHEYQVYLGGNYIRCADCGLLIPKIKNTKYCTNCKKPTKPSLQECACVDCGKKFTRNKFAIKRIRCLDCQRERNKVMKKNRNKQYYLNKNILDPAY